MPHYYENIYYKFSQLFHLLLTKFDFSCIKIPISFDFHHFFYLHIESWLTTFHFTYNTTHMHTCQNGIDQLHHSPTYVVFFGLFFCKIPKNHFFPPNSPQMQLHDPILYPSHTINTCYRLVNIKLKFENFDFKRYEIPAPWPLNLELRT